MTEKNEWHNFPDEKPEKNDFFIVRLNANAARSAGLSSPIIIAEFDCSNWTSNPSLVPFPLPEGSVIQWHNIPHT